MMMTITCWMISKTALADDDSDDEEVDDELPNSDEKIEEK